MYNSCTRNTLAAPAPESSEIREIRIRPRLRHCKCWPCDALRQPRSPVWLNVLVSPGSDYKYYLRRGPLTSFPRSACSRSVVCNRLSKQSSQQASRPGSARSRSVEADCLSHWRGSARLMARASLPAAATVVVVERRRSDEEARANGRGHAEAGRCPVSSSHSRVVAVVVIIFCGYGVPKHHGDA